MNESCPWYYLFNILPPPFPFCGEMKCSLVVDPVDTYSNFVYLIIAYWTYKKQKENSYIKLKYFYTLPIMIFIGSVFFHMSFNYLSLVFDFYGIFALIFLGIQFNITRLKSIEFKTPYRISYIFSLIYCAVMFLSYPFKLHIGIYSLPLISYILFTEFKIKMKKNEINIKYKSFFISVALLMFGYGSMILEGKHFRIGCSGEYSEIIQLHTIWHLFSAMAMIFIFKFYEQFEVKRGSHDPL